MLQILKFVLLIDFSLQMVKCRGCSGGRHLILLGLLTLGLGWGLFGVSGGLASNGPGSSKHFEGYEWVPGLFMMGALLFMLRFPKKSTFVEEEILENHITGRLIFVGLFTIIGFIAGGVMVLFVWFIPPAHTVTIAPKIYSGVPVHQRGIFSSPSPSPSPIPVRIKVNTDPNPLVGGLMMGHFLALFGSIALFWFYVSEDPDEERFNAIRMT